ncbi:MAG: GGDEF domain-containing protein [Pseudomonadota bacterium]
MAIEQNNYYSDSAAREIRRLEGISEHGVRLLRFSDVLERRFVRAHNRQALLYRRLCLLVAALAIGAFGLLDYVLFGEELKHIAPMRHGVGFTVVLVGGILTMSPLFYRYQQEFLFQLTLCTVHMTTLVLLVAPDRIFMHYLPSYMLVMMFAAVICHMFFLRALMIGAMVLISVNLVLFPLRPQPFEVIASFNITFFCTALITWVASYYLEYTARKDFLQQRILELERRQLSAANEQLQMMATTDPLTGLFNRRELERQLQAEWRRASRSACLVSIILIDIDDFKPYNDHFGHQAGDACLETVAALLQEQFQRVSDCAARYGGEEFIVLLPDTDGEAAHQLAEKFRHALAERNIPHPHARAADHVTASIGVATTRASSEGHYEHLIHAADEALYRAKESGRNRVVSAGD